MPDETPLPGDHLTIHCKGRSRLSMWLDTCGVSITEPLVGKRDQAEPRRYIAVIQDERGYPGPGAHLDPAPPDGPKPPQVVTVVKADDYVRLREAVATALTSLSSGPLKDGYAYAVLEKAMGKEADRG